MKSAVSDHLKADPQSVVCFPRKTRVFYVNTKVWPGYQSEDEVVTQLGLNNIQYENIFVFYEDYAPTDKRPIRIEVLG